MAEQPEAKQTENQTRKVQTIIRVRTTEALTIGTQTIEVRTTGVLTTDILTIETPKEKVQQIKNQGDRLRKAEGSLNFESKQIGINKKRWIVSNVFYL
jgi:hypothetical protein